LGFPTSRTIPSVWLHLTVFWIICLSSHASAFHSVLGCLYLFILAKIYIVIYLYKDKIISEINKIRK